MCAEWNAKSVHNTTKMFWLCFANTNVCAQWSAKSVCNITRCSFHILVVVTEMCVQNGMQSICTTQPDVVFIISIVLL